MQEHVLVVPTAMFHELGHFQGFCAEVDRYFAALTDPAHTSFRPRDQVEHDPSFKQLIPYVVLQHASSRGEVTVFQYTRGRGQGEGRLHAKRSIGIGGHISAIDGLPGGDIYHEGLRRELDEEVAIDSPGTLRCVGLINDDQTDVGRVHLGIVHIYELQSPAVRPREAELIESGFRPVRHLLSELDRFETWSQICLQALYRDET
jgi:predicted NUDIX family phosphoesterase